MSPAKSGSKRPARKAPARVDVSTTPLGIEYQRAEQTNPGIHERRHQRELSRKLKEGSAGLGTDVTSRTLAPGTMVPVTDIYLEKPSPFPPNKLPELLNRRAKLNDQLRRQIDRILRAAVKARKLEKAIKRIERKVSAVGAVLPELGGGR